MKTVRDLLHKSDETEILKKLILYENSDAEHNYSRYQEVYRELTLHQSTGEAELKRQILMEMRLIDSEKPKYEFLVLNEDQEKKVLVFDTAENGIFDLYLPDSLIECYGINLLLAEIIRKVSFYRVGSPENTVLDESICYILGNPETRTRIAMENYMQRLLKEVQYQNYSKRVWEECKQVFPECFYLKTWEYILELPCRYESFRINEEYCKKVFPLNPPSAERIQEMLGSALEYVAGGTKKRKETIVVERYEDQRKLTPPLAYVLKEDGSRAEIGEYEALEQIVDMDVLVKEKSLQDDPLLLGILSLYWLYPYRLQRQKKRDSIARLSNILLQLIDHSS